MNPTAALCRAQEAFHLDRAGAAALENVRSIATKAAKAWGIEAIAAEAREARGERVRLRGSEHLPGVRPADLFFSENPDLGMAGT